MRNEAKDPALFGDALLTEMHGVIGCDPNCVKNYHDVFNGNLGMEAYTAIVGPSLTKEAWDTFLKEELDAATESTGS